MYNLIIFSHLKQQNIIIANERMRNDADTLWCMLYHELSSLQTSQFDGVTDIVATGFHFKFSLYFFFFVHLFALHFFFHISVMQCSQRNEFLTFSAFFLHSMKPLRRRQKYQWQKAAHPPTHVHATNSTYPVIEMLSIDVAMRLNLDFSHPMFGIFDAFIFPSDPMHWQIFGLWRPISTFSDASLSFTYCW